MTFRGHCCGASLGWAPRSNGEKSTRWQTITESAAEERERHHTWQAAAAAGYLAYSGPYVVDEDTSIVHHDVVVSLLPKWLGTVQLRHSTLAGDRLTLVAAAPVGNATVRSTLV